jgi:hypothetical protein
VGFRLNVGPSTKTEPYLAPTSEVWEDSRSDYCFKSCGRVADVSRTRGRTRAFISRWSLGKDLTVVAGRDQSRRRSERVYLERKWMNRGASLANFDRLCSCDLLPTGAFLLDQRLEKVVCYDSTRSGRRCVLPPLMRESLPIG